MSSILTCLFTHINKKMFSFSFMPFFKIFIKMYSIKKL